MSMMRANGRHTTAGRMRGFTLLEVLIALVVLSFGLLGIAALQGVGLRSSQGAYLTSQAGLLAYDIADRIRANPENFGTYDGFETDCPETVATTPLVMADLQEWSCAVEALLPNGEGRIAGLETVLPGIGTVTRYTVTLEWEDLQSDGGPPWDFVLVFDI